MRRRGSDVKRERRLLAGLSEALAGDFGSLAGTGRGGGRRPCGDGEGDVKPERRLLAGFGKLWQAVFSEASVGTGRGGGLRRDSLR